MKSYPLPIIVAFVLFAGPLAYASEDSNKAIKNTMQSLRDCLKAGLQASQEANAPENEADESARQTAFKGQESIRYSNAIDSLSSLEHALQSGDLSTALQYAERLPSTFPDLGDCHDSMKTLVKAILAGQESQRKEARADLEALKSRLSIALPEAQRAPELDNYFAEINDLDRQLNQNRGLNHLRSELQKITAITAKWQEYLAYRNAGDPRSAETQLNQIVNALEDVPLVPRSEALDRQLQLKGLDVNLNDPTSPPFTVGATLQKVRSYEHLEAAREKLTILTKFKDSRADARTGLNTIEDLLAVNTLIDRGDPLLGLRALPRVSNHSSFRSEWVDAVRQSLQAKALRGAIPKKHRHLADSASVEEIMLKAAQAMQADRDWDALWTFLTVVQHRFQQILPGVTETIRTIENYLYAVRLEEAGRLADALSQYDEVLQQPASFGPQDEALEAVRRLRVDKAEALLADQMREAKKPGRSRSEPRSRFHSAHASRSARSLPNSKEFEEAVERIVERKFSAYLKKQAAKQVQDIKAKEADKSNADTPESRETKGNDAGTSE